MDGKEMGQVIDKALKKLARIDEKLEADAVLLKARRFLRENRILKTTLPKKAAIITDRWGNVTKHGDCVRPGCNPDGTWISAWMRK